MQRYIIRRIIFSFFAIWATMTVTFFFVRAIPGDPISAMAGDEADAEVIARINTRLGLDRPVYIQYFLYVRGLLELDLGESIHRRLSVLDEMKSALPRTLSLTLISFILAVSIGIPAGVISAVRRYSIWDYIASFSAFAGLAMPSFWLAIILMIVFGVQLGWLPTFGYARIEDGLWNWFSHLIMPAIASGLGFSAILARQTRSAMLEVLSQDYIRTAYAKGLNERWVIWRHAFRNSLIPVITVMGIALALLLAGSVVVENVFAIRGLGRLLIGSIIGRDYPVVTGMILMIAFIFIFANLLVDILYAFVNPRIHYD